MGAYRGNCSSADYIKNRDAMVCIWCLEEFTRLSVALATSSLPEKKSILLGVSLAVFSGSFVSLKWAEDAR